MKIKLIVVGSTDDGYVRKGVEEYVKRLKHYIQFETIVINDVKTGKKTNENIQKQLESELIITKLEKSDYIILLDEKGQEYNSVEFSNFIQKRMNSGMNIVFIIGGPFGFSDTLYELANSKIALSRLTFSHQMIRLFFTEQLYRAFTILRGEKYHHS